jgi:hypothetical protein
MRSEPAKIGSVLGVGILAMLLGFLAAALGDLGVGLAVFVVLLFGGIYALTRIFRGPSERVGDRRAWWRLTENPTAGYVWAALFGARAVWVGLTLGLADPEGAITVTLFLVPALAFLGSSIRMAVGRRAATS